MSLDMCDESKCVSRGRSDLFDGAFTCYGDDDIFPMMCANGFLPVVVNNEATFEVDVSGKFDVALNYFTCCPPNETLALTSKQCSDPIAADDYETAELLCYDGETPRYPHPMKSIPDDENDLDLTFYKCCDFINANGNNTDFLDETECVPYRDENFKVAMVKNKVGILPPRVCKIPDFPVPRAIGEGTINALGEYQYQCCRDGDALEPFFQDSAFYVTVYPIAFLYCIAAIVSAIVILGLLLPLLKQIKNGTYASSNRMSQSTRRREKPYSSYNLYLVHLAILDLIYCLYNIIRFASIVDQQLYPRYYSWLVESELSMSPYFLFSSFYSLANMWINAVICYEVWALLKSSEQHKKRASPTLKQVNLEAGSVFFLLITIAISFYYTNEYSGLDVEDSLMKCISGMAYIPFFYIAYVSIRARKFVRSLGNSAVVDSGMRQLSIFFMRIVGVFILVWIPTTIILLLIYFGSNFGYRIVMIVFVLMALQPIMTFVVILTKEDVKKYILDLLMFRYCRHNERPTSVFGSSTTSSTRTTKGKFSSTTASLRSGASASYRGSSLIGSPMVSGDYSATTRDSTSCTGRSSMEEISEVENTHDTVHVAGSSMMNVSTSDRTSTIRDVSAGRDRSVQFLDDMAVPHEDQQASGMP